MNDMEKNIFLEIEYRGTAYHGFQLQAKPGKRETSVQQIIERALRKLFRKKIRLTYTSRTDKGVHARAQGVNFYVKTDIPLYNIKRALNTFLPDDVRVKNVKVVPREFHSRFWCLGKTYRYIILNKKEGSVFHHDFAWHVPQALDLGKMRAAAKHLAGKRDFSVFAKEAGAYQTCVRDMKAVIVKKKGSFIYVDMQADGFLRSMCRNIVNFLVEVGRGEIAFERLPGILAGKAAYEKHPAPAQGLYLWKARYKK